MVDRKRKNKVRDVLSREGKITQAQYDRRMDIFEKGTGGNMVGAAPVKKVGLHHGPNLYEDGYMARPVEGKVFDGQKYWLIKSGLNIRDAHFWKDEYLNQGYKVRVIKGTSFTDKHEYNIYRR